MGIWNRFSCRSTHCMNDLVEPNANIHCKSFSTHTFDGNVSPGRFYKSPKVLDSHLKTSLC